jgi:DNA (cytosine-5)-methyltransferase 1
VTTGDLIIDLFAGGGGASTGIAMALGRPVNIAVNHDRDAIRMHRSNHPETKHFLEDVWQVQPKDVCGRQRPALLWASPDCTHFSRAKGKAPRSQGLRCLANVVIDWARDVRPRVIIVENVEEFMTWGPLDADGHPDKTREGEDFKAWAQTLVGLGYSLEWKSLVAADYGAPTTRKRLFLVARADGRRPAWPTATHGRSRPQSWRSAAEIIDWSIPCPSIFGRRRSLAKATLARVARGIHRFVVDAPTPFLVRHGHYSTITGAGLRDGCGAGTFRGQSLDMPLATVCATNDKHLVVPVVLKHYGGVVGHDVRQPLGTITATDHHALALATLRDQWSDIEAQRVYDFMRGHYVPSAGDSSHDSPWQAGAAARMVLVRGMPVVDIGMRMLQPSELFAAQGFPSVYEINVDAAGERFTKTAQTRLAGNSVCPQVAAAIVRANLLEQAA